MILLLEFCGFGFVENRRCFYCAAISFSLCARQFEKALLNDCFCLCPAFPIPDHCQIFHATIAPGKGFH